MRLDYTYHGETVRLGHKTVAAHTCGWTTPTTAAQQCGWVTTRLLMAREFKMAGTNAASRQNQPNQLAISNGTFSRGPSTSGFGRGMPGRGCGRGATVAYMRIEPRHRVYRHSNVAECCYHLFNGAFNYCAHPVVDVPRANALLRTKGQVVLSGKTVYPCAARVDRSAARPTPQAVDINSGLNRRGVIRVQSWRHGARCRQAAGRQRPQR